MRSFRGLGIFGPLLLLSTARAHAAPFGLSDAALDRYLSILEIYVLPFMVVSTVVLFCGYLASRIFHRAQSRTRDADRLGADQSAGTEEGTEAFLRELTAAPPITDQTAEATNAPQSAEESRKPRQSHPLLRRRAAARREAAAKDDGPTLRKPPAVEPPVVEPRAKAAPPEASPEPGGEPILGRARAPEADTGLRLRLSTDSDEGLGDDSGMPTPDRDDAALGGTIPRLQAAFRRPRMETAPLPVEPVEPPEMGTAAETDATIPPPSAVEPERPAGLFDATAEVAAEPSERRQSPPSEERIAELRKRADRLLSERAAVEPEPAEASLPEEPASDEDATIPRKEPTVSVVQTLQASASVPAPDIEATKARAAEIVDSLDYIASVLQQGTVLLGERQKSKQGMSLEDVRTLRVTGYDEPEHVLEDLRYLGGDAPEEVLAAYGAVSSFNGIVSRLEQMAESEPLDEGWNDLVRARVSDTIYRVGQVRKTLGIYRRTPGRPANAGMSSGGAGDDPDEGKAKSVPFGRRQV